MRPGLLLIDKLPELGEVEARQAWAAGVDGEVGLGFFRVLLGEAFNLLFLRAFKGDLGFGDQELEGLLEAAGLDVAGDLEAQLAGDGGVAGAVGGFAALGGGRPTELIVRVLLELGESGCYRGLRGLVKSLVGRSVALRDAGEEFGGAE